MNYFLFFFLRLSVSLTRLTLGKRIPLFFGGLGGGGGEFAWKLVWMCGCGVVSATTPIGGNLATGRGENEQKQLRRYGLHH